MFFKRSPYYISAGAIYRFSFSSTLFAKSFINYTAFLASSAKLGRYSIPLQHFNWGKFKAVITTGLAPPHPMSQNISPYLGFTSLINGKKCSKMTSPYVNSSLSVLWISSFALSDYDTF